MHPLLMVFAIQFATDWRSASHLKRHAAAPLAAHRGPPTAPAPPPAVPAPNMTLPCGGPHCVYSSNCTTNPGLCHLGKAVIPQCTFDNWLGDASRQLGTAQHPHLAHYRGQRVLNATLKRIAKELLSAASKVLVVGSDGGGNLLYIQADRIRHILAAGVGVQPQRLDYAVVPVEGWWVNWNGVTSGFSLQQAIVGTNDQRGLNTSDQCRSAPNASSCAARKGCGVWSEPVNRTTGRTIVNGTGSCSAAGDFQVPGGNAWKFMNFSGAISHACRAAVDPTGTNTSSHWRCLLAEVAGRHIESRIFPIEQLWGVFGSFCLVNSEFVDCDTGYNCGRCTTAACALWSPGAAA